MGSVTVAQLSEVPENGNKAFDVKGRSVLICRSAQGVFAVENQCSHAAAALEGGRVRGFHIFCPLHGARFDMRDGSTSGALTRTPIKTYPCTVEGDTVSVELDAE